MTKCQVGRFSCRFSISMIFFNKKTLDFLFQYCGQRGSPKRSIELVPICQEERNQRESVFTLHLYPVSLMLMPMIRLK